mmetsp:Transcript_32316/g.80103  ORF Transcript_32316/g.80103 Transcript_32316/m.80103 type:complete len:84 (+) Transcript_32316:135-386(+)
MSNKRMGSNCKTLLGYVRWGFHALRLCSAVCVNGTRLAKGRVLRCTTLAHLCRPNATCLGWKGCAVVGEALALGSKVEWSGRR